MREKPDLPDEAIVACLQTAYGVRAAEVVFLPVGADQFSFVYRIAAVDGTPYFVKLRLGRFNALCVALPKFLSDQGLRQIIAPLPTVGGRLWADLRSFKLIAYPFVDGLDGYARELSDQNWTELGAALKRVHVTTLPATLSRSLHRETYSPRWRQNLRNHLERAEHEVFEDPLASTAAAYLKTRRGEILDLEGRASRLAQVLRARSHDQVVCHSDLHAGNILIDARDGLYIVDWDDPALAPKERDLMFVGGGQFGNGRTYLEEEAVFYRGYGATALDAEALAYYRLERIIEDLAVECDQLLTATASAAKNREQELAYLMATFEPANVIAHARRSDAAVRSA